MFGFVVGAAVESVGVVPSGFGLRLGGGGGGVEKVVFCASFSLDDVGDCGLLTATAICATMSVSLDRLPCRSAMARC